VAELERMAELALVEARRRAEEALSPETPPERVAALVVEEFEDLPSPPGLATRLRRDGSEERARSVAAEVQRLAPGSVTALTLAAEVAGVFDTIRLGPMSGSTRRSRRSSTRTGLSSSPSICSRPAGI
jgi:hypothetical protein